MPTLDQIRAMLLEGVPPGYLNQSNSEQRKGWFFPGSRGEKAEAGLSYEGSNEKSPEELEQTLFARVAEGAQVSETQILRELLNPLTEAAKQVDFLDVDVSSLRAAVDAFCRDIESVGQHLGAVKAFEKLIADLASDYQSLNDLRDQLSQMNGAFHTHLAQTARMLEPAKKLKVRASEVAYELEQLNELKQWLDGLATTFEVGQSLANLGQQSNFRSRSWAIGAVSRTPRRGFAWRS